MKLSYENNAMGISSFPILLSLCLSQPYFTTAAPAPAPQAAVSKASAAVNPSAAAAQGAVAPTASFETALCTNPDIADASIAPNERWDAVDTSTAWTAAVDSWTSRPSTNGLTFPQQISNYFNGPDQMLCGDTSARDGCSSDVTCDNVKYPAGMFILNSMVSVSDLNYNIFDSMGKGETAVTTLMGTFSTTFAPISDPDAGAKLLLDLLGLGFALFAAPTWNSFLKAVPFFKANGNTLGTIKDTVNPLVSNGVTISKDTGLSGAVIEATNELNANLASMVKAWTTTLDVYNQQLFNGSDASNTLLFTQIDEGKVLEAGFQQDDLMIQNAMEKAVYGYLIPQAWSLSNGQISPVVVDSGAACGTIDPVKKYISVDIGDASFVCYNNIIYYLVGASGLVDDCFGSAEDNELCDSTLAPSLKALPGLGELDGNQWGGVLKDDFIIGAVNSYAANGNQNGWAATDPTSADALDDIFDNGLRAAGVVQIPVCSAEEAYGNWLYAINSGKTAMSAHYPCN
ncbi:MAG: hypothetical protein HETSPECPRED_008325 [Heterodermia speciosa]|uniref:Uncharacterized protein n=1 Tax=Heterodermia speciosa TaxID=116794 RepID=A0A8H3FY88_9LECA|nr:MAG: hypothetical protein HETSPECPRED_008325 [Heterodermia speciosa]